MKEGEAKNAIIRLFHVYRNYGAKNALVDVTLDIYKNEFLFISGPNGAGKTTLLKLLYFAEPVSDGQILVDGMNLSRIPRKNIPFLRRIFGIVFQDYKLISTKTVYENVALVLEAAGQNRRFIQKKVNSVLRTVGMEQRLHALPPSLSGGEQQRVAIARAVVGDPKIILAGFVFDLLKSCHTRGATVVIATHDRQLIQKSGGRVVHLNAGRLVETPAI